jgi:hypothetical protein
MKVSEASAKHRCKLYNFLKRQKVSNKLIYEIRRVNFNELYYLNNSDASENFARYIFCFLKCHKTLLLSFGIF